jgi:hypothetical protein
MQYTSTQYYIKSIGDRCVYKPSSIRSADVVKTFKAIHFTTTPLQKAHISHLDMACSKLYMHVKSLKNMQMDDIHTMSHL